MFLRRKLRLRWRAEKLIRAIGDLGVFTSDGLPYPNMDLRALVSGDPEDTRASFQQVGRTCLNRIADSLRKDGANLNDFNDILDFGCGCGRTIRHFQHLKPEQLIGTDYNPKLIQWCQQNLPFARFDVNQLNPPLGCEDEKFELVYAFSVFTHLPESLQLAWMVELRRVLKPTGYLALSTLGLDCLSAEQRTGELVVLREHDAGKNQCSAYHAFDYVRDTLGKGFSIVDFVERGVGQDFYLLKKQVLVVQMSNADGAN